MISWLSWGLGFTEVEEIAFQASPGRSIFHFSAISPICRSVKLHHCHVPESSLRSLRERTRFDPTAWDGDGDGRSMRRMIDAPRRICGMWITVWRRV